MSSLPNVTDRFHIVDDDDWHSERSLSDDVFTGLFSDSDEEGDDIRDKGSRPQTCTATPEQKHDMKVRLAKAMANLRKADHRRKTDKTQACERKLSQRPFLTVGGFKFQSPFPSTLSIGNILSYGLAALMMLIMVSAFFIEQRTQHAAAIAYKTKCNTCLSQQRIMNAHEKSTNVPTIQSLIQSFEEQAASTIEYISDFLSPNGRNTTTPEFEYETKETEQPKAIKEPLANDVKANQKETYASGLQVGYAKGKEDGFKEGYEAAQKAERDRLAIKLAEAAAAKTRMGYFKEYYDQFMAEGGLYDRYTGTVRLRKQAKAEKLSKWFRGFERLRFVPLFI